MFVEEKDGHTVLAFVQQQCASSSWIGASSSKSNNKNKNMFPSCSYSNSLRVLVNRETWLARTRTRNLADVPSRVLHLRTAATRVTQSASALDCCPERERPLSRSCNELLLRTLMNPMNRMLHQHPAVASSKTTLRATSPTHKPRHLEHHTVTPLCQHVEPKRN